MTSLVVFHHPLPIVPEGASGSQVRPFRMLETFRELGYDVRVVAGTAAERRQAIASVDAEVRKGIKLAFVYGESSTMPMALAEPHHLPVRPFMDFAFFRRLRRGGTPVGAFYPDVHWRFEESRRRVLWYKRAVALPGLLSGRLLWMAVSRRDRRWLVSRKGGTGSAPPHARVQLN